MLAVEIDHGGVIVTPTSPSTEIIAPPRHCFGFLLASPGLPAALACRCQHHRWHARSGASRGPMKKKRQGRTPANYRGSTHTLPTRSGRARGSPPRRQRALPPPRHPTFARAVRAALSPTESTGVVPSAGNVSRHATPCPRHPAGLTRRQIRVLSSTCVQSFAVTRPKTNIGI